MEDEVKKAELTSTISVEVAGKTVKLKKWALRQSIKFSSEIIELVKKLPAGKITDIEAIKKLDMKDLAEQGGLDTLVDMLSACVIRGGSFASEEAAKEWVEDLSLDEALILLAETLKMNFGPLKKGLETLARSVARQTSSSTTRPPTSSKPSSEQATPTPT